MISATRIKADDRKTEVREAAKGLRMISALRMFGMPIPLRGQFDGLMARRAAEVLIRTAEWLEDHPGIAAGLRIEAVATQLADELELRLEELLAVETRARAEREVSAHSHDKVSGRSHGEVSGRSHYDVSGHSLPSSAENAGWKMAELVEAVDAAVALEVGQRLTAIEKMVMRLAPRDEVVDMIMESTEPLWTAHEATRKMIDEHRRMIEDLCRDRL